MRVHTKLEKRAPEKQNPTGKGASSTALFSHFEKTHTYKCPIFLL